MRDYGAPRSALPTQATVPPTTSRSFAAMSHDVLVAAQVAVWQYFPEDDELIFNAHVAAVLGSSGVAKGVADGQLRELLRPILVAPAQPGSLVSLEHTLRVPHRAARRFRIVAQWSGTCGSDTALRGTLQDVTGAIASTSSGDLRDRYRLLVDLSPDAIIVHCNGYIVFANQATASMIRAASPEDLIGESILSFVAPASRAALGSRIAAMRRRTRIRRLPKQCCSVATARRSWSSRYRFEPAGKASQRFKSSCAT